MNQPVHLKHPFSPIIDADSRVLILGTFPSVISRKQSFFYANPQNRFWPLMSALFEDDAGKDNASRTAFCHRHHLALYDVIASCTITGSADSTIHDVKANDIAAMVKGTRIHVVFTTGRKASELYVQLIECSLKHISLPSTSSANARMRFDDLLKEYEVVKEYAEKND